MDAWEGEGQTIWSGQRGGSEQSTMRTPCAEHWGRIVELFWLGCAKEKNAAGPYLPTGVDGASVANTTPTWWMVVSAVGTLQVRVGHGPLDRSIVVRRPT